MAKLSSFLLELEERFTRRAVIELQDQLATRPFPRLVGLPDVVVAIRRRVVAQATCACGDGFLDVIGRASRAGDLRRLRIARHEDVQPLIAAQGELDGNRTACRD